MITSNIAGLASLLRLFVDAKLCPLWGKSKSCLPKSWQIIANLLDNSISFSDDNRKIEIEVEETSNNLVILIKDEGPGFSETSPQKIFKRFYSNRPKSFGKHSGLGLNIVKNIVELHEGTISASNRLNKGGAQVEVLLPKFS